METDSSPLPSDPSDGGTRLGDGTAGKPSSRASGRGSPTGGAEPDGRRGKGMERHRILIANRCTWWIAFPCSTRDGDMIMRLLSLLLLLLAGVAFPATPPYRALIVDGQNNHGMWPKTTVMMKHYLEETGLFSVDIERTRYTWNGAQELAKYPLENGRETQALPQPVPDPEYAPDFSRYHVVLNNNGFRAAPWPEKTRKAFEAYVQDGGGVVIVHAANNAWPEWKAYNLMIGLGGWGNRNEKHGPYVYFNEDNELVRDPSPGRGGSHGPQHEFVITLRNSTHPITRGLPLEWLHTRDELYDSLRGPAQNMHILATAWSSREKRGKGRHEPMMMVLTYGKGRIFHTPMGHADYSMECAGFIVTLQRGAEWAATGKVTRTTLPEDFPTAEKSSKRAFE